MKCFEKCHFTDCLSVSLWDGKTERCHFKEVIFTWNPEPVGIGDTQNGCLNSWCVIYAKEKPHFLLSGVWLCVLIKRCVVAEWSRTGGLMFCELEWHWETLGCCMIHRLGISIKVKRHWWGLRGSSREKHWVCFLQFVLCKHYFLIHPQGVKVRQVLFSSFKCHKVIYKTIRISIALYEAWFMWWTQMSSSVPSLNKEL